MTIDTTEVKRIAELARLELGPSSVERHRRQLESILDYVAVLDRLEVDEVAPSIHADRPERGLRADDPRPSLPVRDALANAPDAGADRFRVPRVLDPENG